MNRDQYYCRRRVFRDLYGWRPRQLRSALSSLVGRPLTDLSRCELVGLAADLAELEHGPALVRARALVGHLEIYRRIGAGNAT